MRDKRTNPAIAGWAVYVSKGTGTIRHVIPVRDTIWHTVSPDCVCGPREELHILEGHPDHEVHIHHALDNREAGER